MTHANGTHANGPAGGAAQAHRKSRRPAADRPGSASASRPARLAFTLDLSTGAVIRIETVGAADERRDLSEGERLALSSGAGEEPVEALIERAFEAGIACMLRDEEDEGPDDAAEADLRRLILKPLMDDGPAAGLMRRDVVERAIVETLIRHGLRPRPDEAGPARDERAGPTAPLGPDA